MRQNLPNVALFLVLAAGLLAGSWYIDKQFPKPQAPTPAEPPPPREALQALAGAAVGETLPARSWPAYTRVTPPVAITPPAPVAPPTPAAPSKPAELIAFGDDSFFNKVLLTTRGGSIQQLTLTRFDEANRLGREVKTPAGTVQPLRLIPGLARPRDKETLVEPDGGYHPDPAPGPVPAGTALSDPSYAVYHYYAADDPARPASEQKSEADKFPSSELGDRIWNVAENRTLEGGEKRVAFETTLGAPYFLKLRKTFTLAATDYHVGFQFDIEALPGREKGKGKFRYQVVGARGVPVEGEWYAPSYRNVMVGTRNASGTARRTIEDALTIQTQAGGAAVPRGPEQFMYAAVGSQYFASALAIDETQPRELREAIWDYVRPTREPHPWDNPTQLFLGDVTFRAVAAPVDPAPGETVSHKYLIYNGPMKVRLLEQLTNKEGATEADPALVNRYLDGLTLKTLTDAPSPNFFGRFANSIYWSDVVIKFTNVMHGVLGFLHRYVPVWGLDIMLLTIGVRMLLFPFSRIQQKSMAKMQAKQARMKPELDKLAEKYKDDPATLQQEKTRLMLRHGINPASAMGGCLLLFAQMPIFMGLYFCLQESVFFRQQPFLWFQNLAAPDMTVWWTEHVPYVSAPEALGGTLYLGPFLNVLPLIAVSLIFLQQHFTMPPPADEQQANQQFMMKFMVIFMAVFFYKVPAGLCVYFICSTSWALLERLLIKKPTFDDKGLPPLNADPVSGGRGPAGPGTKPEEATGFMARMKNKIAEAQRQADEQAQRQIRNPNPPGVRNPERKKRRKK